MLQGWGAEPIPKSPLVAVSTRVDAYSRGTSGRRTEVLDCCLEAVQLPGSEPGHRGSKGSPSPGTRGPGLPTEVPLLPIRPSRQPSLPQRLPLSPTLPLARDINVCQSRHPAPCPRTRLPIPQPLPSEITYFHSAQPRRLGGTWNRRDRPWLHCPAPHSGARRTPPGKGKTGSVRRASAYDHIFNH